MICRKCSSNNPNIARFCHYCGFPLLVPSQRPDTRRRWLLIVVLAGLVVIVWAVWLALVLGPDLWGTPTPAVVVVSSTYTTTSSPTRTLTTTITPTPTPTVAMAATQTALAAEVMATIQAQASATVGASIPTPIDTLTLTPTPPTPPTGALIQSPTLPTGTPSPSVAPTWTPTNTPALPHIAYFNCSPCVINQGQTATLSWDLSGATAVYLDGQGVSAPGSTTVRPMQTTTYRLAVINNAGQVEQSVTVQVLSTPTSTWTPTPTLAPPHIAYFNCSPCVINQGQTATLSWDLSGATAAYLDGQGVSAPGSTTVRPMQTTTYRLVAVNSAGQVERSITVQVLSTPTPTWTPTPTLTPTPTKTPTPTATPTRPRPAGNLVRNPGFEEGGTKEYRYWSWNPSTGICSRAIYTSGEAHGGSRFLATGSSDDYPNCSSVYQDIWITPQPGNSYTLGIWLRSPWSPQSLSVNLWATGGSRSDAVSHTVSLDGNWRCFEMTLQVSHGGNNRLRVEVYLPNRNLDVNLDDVVVWYGEPQICP